jgi:flagellar hook-basal body complex protein FliE
MTDISSFSRATGAYNDALRAAQNIINRVEGASSTEETNAARGSSFFDMLSSSLQGVSQSGHKAEGLATRALSGKAELTDVMTAISEAETSLNTVVAIRDRVITAYQDIIKMPI